MQMNRRNFLMAAAAGFGAAALGGLPALAGGGRGLDRIGLQLYTLRSLMEKDVAKTLAFVAELGYREVEFAGYFDHTPAEIKAMLASEGLTAPSTHVSMTHLNEHIDAVIETALTVGHRYVVMPWLEPEERGGADVYRIYAEQLNRAGEACRKAGLTLAYHNHAFEFEAVDGIEPYDILMGETDPRLLKIQLDLYWTTKAGRDPLDYFARYPGRFVSCHVKDMRADGEMTEVGGGTIDFARIFAASEKAGIRHYFVEHDEPADAAASVRASIEYLKKLRF